jgi:hypothetical protein
MTNFHNSKQNSTTTQRNCSKRAEPSPADPLGKWLCEVFSHPWRYIVAAAPANVAEKPSWRTETRHPVRPRILWDLWQDSGQLVGVRFDHSTAYAMIDIDVFSVYHPSKAPNTLSELRAALEAIGIHRLIPIRSSWSGGLHVYIPLPEAVPTFWLAVALKQALETQGFVMRQGQLEVFPNVKSYGKDRQFTEYNAHRLPLQPSSGSTLLDNDLQPTVGGLAQFLLLWKTAASGQDLKHLKRAIDKARKTKSFPSSFYSRKVEKLQRDLLREIEQGWTDYGQTNHLLQSIACYGVIFQGLSDTALVDFVKQTAINSPGYKKWCRHQHEIQKRARDQAAAAEKRYWPLGGTPKRSKQVPSDDSAQSNNIVSFNRQRAKDAQVRIQQAVTNLENKGVLPEGVTARMRAVAAEAKCSLTTLQKYKSLWHPQLCVMPATAGSSTKEQQDTADIAEQPKPASTEGLHTPPHMKGMALFSGSEENLKPDRIGEGSGRGTTSYPQPAQTTNSLASVLEKLQQRIASKSTFVQQRDECSSECHHQNHQDRRRLIKKKDRPVTPSVALHEHEGFDDVLMRIYAHFRRLGWGFGQDYRFIAEQFQGKCIGDLTRDELLLLLYRLQQRE